jgi:hypothetical protein
MSTTDMAKPASRGSVVKQGGIAQEASSAEDVTRDTYGDSKPAPVNKDREKRAAEANRAAAAAGIPGVTVPEPPSEAEGVQDEQSRSTDDSGDYIASRQDVPKLRARRS